MRFHEYYQKWNSVGILTFRFKLYLFIENWHMYEMLFLPTRNSLDAVGRDGECVNVWGWGWSYREYIIYSQPRVPHCHNRLAVYYIG